MKSEYFLGDLEEFNDSDVIQNIAHVRSIAVQLTSHDI